jgi:hypothetical protein
MPHAQTKSDTSASPRNLAAFLDVLVSPTLQPADRINIEGVTGCGIEGEGKVALAIEDGRLREAHDRLSPNYTLEWTTDLYWEYLSGANPNQPGTLLGAIENAKAAHPDRAIDSVLIGQEGRGHKFYVQVTFVDSVWGPEPPTDEHPEQEG